MYCSEELSLLGLTAHTETLPFRSHLEISKNTSRIFMKMQKCNRLAIEDTQLFFSKGLAVSQVPQQRFETRKRCNARVLHDTS